MGGISICVATDCDGEKVNLRFLFDAAGPSVSRLLNYSTTAFNNYFRLKGISRAFAVNSAVVFNDVHCTWDRLERTTQLLHNSQVYLFQPDTLDIPAAIPEPYEGEPLLSADCYLPLRGATISTPIPAIKRIAPQRFASPKGGEKTRFSSPLMFRWAGANKSPVGFRRTNSVSFDDCVNDRSRHNRSCSHSFSKDIHSTGISDDSSYLLHQNGGRGTDKHYSSFSSGGSILREEREKIEFQLSLPLDEMRRCVREETRRLDTTISTPIKRI